MHTMSAMAAAARVLWCGCCRLMSPHLQLGVSTNCAVARMSRLQFSSTETATAKAPVDTKEDPTAAKYVPKNERPAHTPQKAKTNTLNFLNKSDIQKRTHAVDIPFFTAGSYLSVTRADPYSPTGVTKFVGICIARRNKGLGSTFILRNVISGIGVEKMFELYSPAIKEIKVLKLERRRRAKLYYLRDKPAKYSTVNENMEPVNSDGKVLKYKRKRGAPA